MNTLVEWQLKMAKLYGKGVPLLIRGLVRKSGLVYVSSSIPTVAYLTQFRRSYKVLAIESSCDDSCVSLIDRPEDPSKPPVVLSHLKKTLNSTADGGIIPTKAHLHHQQSLAGLVQELNQLNGNPKVDLVCVTRGPGMPGSLTIGLEVAKGLSVAWGVPLVGVHHMLGHLLVARMSSNGTEPRFPFVSLLVSGGHTILVYLENALKHEILAQSIDIAAGDSLDKCARLVGIQGIMLGKELESFVFQKDINDTRNKAEIMDQLLQDLKSNTDIKMDLPNPLQNKIGRVNVAAYSFAAFITAVKTAADKYYKGDIASLPVQTRRLIGLKIQQAIFKHIVDRTKVAFDQNKEKLAGVTDFVCSGGVGSNILLKKMLHEELEAQYGIKKFHFPEPALCTDNAVMIGWAGIELWEKELLSTDLSVLPISKWPLNDIEGVDGWVRKAV